MSRKSVVAGDLTVSYTELGDGPPLVLLHGGLSTAEMSWGDHPATLARHFRVYAPDTRGHGLTDNPSGHLAYDQYADDVVAFCRALDIEKPLILGYSDGGQTAIELALRHPGFARALVMGGTISYRTEQYETGTRDFGFSAPGEADYEKIKAGWGDYFDTIEAAHRGDGKPGYMHRLLKQISTLWLTLPNYSDDQLGRIDAPTLVIIGDRDRTAGFDQARRLHDAIAGSELAIVPNAGHGAYELALFWVVVLDFLLRQVEKPDLML